MSESPFKRDISDCASNATIQPSGSAYYYQTDATTVDSDEEKRKEQKRKADHEHNLRLQKARRNGGKMRGF